MVIDQRVDDVDRRVRPIVLSEPRLARVAGEIASAESITASLGNDVDGGAAGFRFAQGARDLDGYFRGVRDVRAVTASHPHDPCAGRVDDVAVHHDAPLRQRIRVSGRGVGGQIVDVVVAPDTGAADTVGTEAGRREPGSQCEQAADVARCRQVPYLGSDKRGGLTRSLDVNGRCGSHHRHSLGKLADRHRRVHGRGEAARQDDVAVLLSGKPR